MAEGANRQAWDHTAQICAVIANCNKDPKKGRPFKAADFNPYTEKTGSTKLAATKENILALKPAIMAMKKG
jgi:hypothetical protein